MNKPVLFSLILILCLGAQAKDRPNVLFIIADDLNNHVSTSGYRPIETPALDALATEGMRFQRAYCQYPVCGPSRASIMSGLYPETTAIVDNYHDIRETRPGTLTLAQAFKKAGYWTARTGKVYHTEKQSPEEDWDANPDRFENDELPIVTEARLAYETEHGSISGKNRKGWMETLHALAPQTRDRKVAPPYGPSGLDDDQHKDGKNALEVIRHLEEKPFGDQPFFIAVGIQKPHVPFLAPDQYFDLYPKGGLQFELPPASFWDQAPKDAQHVRYKQFGFEMGKHDDDLHREYMQAYHACITFIDTQIGRILQALEDTGQKEDTIIVFTSDHGYQLGEHFMWGKGTLFEEVARVPLIIRVPEESTGVKVRAGSQTESLAELIDLFPTLAELCHLAAPEDLQGHSLVPILEDPRQRVRSDAYTVVCRPGGQKRPLEGATLGRAIRTERWRYTEWPNGEELYDLKSDPREWVNLADDPEFAEEVNMMKKRLVSRQPR